MSQRFGYRARAADGSLTQGELTAEGLNQALEQLQARQLTPDSVWVVQGPEDAGKGVDAEILDGRLVSTTSERDEPASSGSQLDLAVQRGLRVLPALKAVEQDLDVPSLRRSLRKAIRTLERTQTFNDLLASDTGRGLIPLVLRHSTGEDLSGATGDWLQALVVQLETRHRHRLVMLYPLVLFLIVLAVLYFLAILVVPAFAEMFREFDLSVPWTTGVVISSSEALTRWSWRRVLIVALIAIGSLGLISVARRRSWLNRLFGSLAAGRDSNLALMHRFTASLAELVRLGIPRSDALRIAGRVTGDHYFAPSAATMASYCRGRQPGDGILSSRVLPPTVMHLLWLGAPDGTVASGLRDVATIYLDRMGARLSWFVLILPAITTGFLGVLIGFVVISLFMPLVSLVSALSG